MSKLRNADNNDAIDADDDADCAPVHVAPHDPRHLLHLGPGALQPREPRVVHSYSWLELVRAVVRAVARAGYPLSTMITVQG